MINVLGYTNGLASTRYTDGDSSALQSCIDPKIGFAQMQQLCLALLHAWHTLPSPFWMWIPWAEAAAVAQHPVQRVRLWDAWPDDQLRSGW